MRDTILSGLQILIVSDHPDLASLFAMVVAACGASAVVARAIEAAVRAVHGRPDAVLLDMATDGTPWAVLVEADRAKVPTVAFTLRCPEPRQVEAEVRSFARALSSTDPVEVCDAVREVARKAA
jgi:DNA-binding response OmpR family regulator